MSCRVCDGPVPKPARGPSGGFCSKQCRERNFRLKDKFKIDIETYRYLLAAQDGVCAVCKEPCSTGRSLAVDHDHATGAIRGLLCLKCNLVMGHCKENRGRLHAMIAYLDHYMPAGN